MHAVSRAQDKMQPQAQTGRAMSKVQEGSTAMPIRTGTEFRERAAKEYKRFEIDKGDDQDINARSTRFKY